MVVHPSLPPEAKPSLLDRRAGLSIPEVDTVFLTHFHGDHRFGIDAFPEAEWLMAGEGLRVVVASDAAMTRDFSRARDYYFSSADTEAAVRSIEEIATTANVVVPGQHNYFLIRR